MTKKKRKMPQETKDKISKNMMGKNKGRKLTQEQKDYISARVRGLVPKKRKKMTQRHKDAISKALMGKYKGRPMHPNTEKAFREQSNKKQTQETKDKISATMTGKKRGPASAAAKKANREAQLRRPPMTQETRDRMSAAKKGKRRSPDNIDAQREFYLHTDQPSYFMRTQLAEIKERGILRDKIFAISQKIHYEDQLIAATDAAYEFTKKHKPETVDIAVTTDGDIYINGELVWEYE